MRLCWTVHDGDGQPLIIKVDGQWVAIDGRRFDADAVRRLRLHMAAALRETEDAPCPDSSA